MPTYLSRTPSSAGNRRLWTWSGWFKKLKDVNGDTVFAGYTDSNNRMRLNYTSDGRIEIFGYISSTQVQVITTRRFQDFSSWYHIVWVWDTAQSTNSNRTKVYINGEQITNWGTQTWPAQNSESVINSNTGQYIGQRGDGSAQLSGYLTDINFIDGQALTPSTFGETDSTTGGWKPKVDFPGLTYGTNGFRCQFGNAAALGTDTSGQSNNFTVNGAGTNAKTVDTATNNFCTFNALDKASNVTLSKGNLIAAIAGAGQTRSVASTMAMSKGKWYWEIYYTADSVSGFVGLVSADIGWSVNSTAYPSSGVNDNVGYNDGGTKYINGSGSSYGASWASGDTISVAVDLDNNTTIFYKNGASQGSISKTFTGSYYLVVQHQSSSGTSNFHLNTGNPAYTISSGNADANGHGNFEYAVPSGYYALCTKNVNQYG
jgi:hypothetical protein